MGGHEVEWFSGTIILGILTLVSFLVIGYTLKCVFIRDSKALPLPITIQISVIVSLFGFALYLALHFTFRLLQHIPGGAHIGLASCRAFTTLDSVGYYLGKGAIYCLFIFRAVHTFENTALQYSRVTSGVLIGIVIAVHLYLTIFFAYYSWDIVYFDTDTYSGRICVFTGADDSSGARNARINMMLEWDLAAGAVIDVLCGLVTVWLLVGRLFILTQKGKSARRSIRFSGEAPHQMNGFRSPTLEDRSSIGDAGVARSASIDSDTRNSQKTDMSGNLNQLSADRSRDILQFHNATRPENDLLSLGLKLLILSSITSMSSVLVYILFITLTGSAYMIDCAANVICLYLSFQFADSVYWNKFGGRFCSRVLFAPLKTCAFTWCTALYSGNTTPLVKNTASDQCCFCLSLEEQSRIYQLSRAEYSLIIKQDEYSRSQIMKQMNSGVSIEQLSVNKTGSTTGTGHKAELPTMVSGGRSSQQPQPPPITPKHSSIAIEDHPSQMSLQIGTRGAAPIEIQLATYKVEPNPN